MTIATLQIEAIGARVFQPEGPLDLTGRSGPLPSFRPGEVFAGDAEAEFVYLLFTAVAAVTINQGDVFTWDNSYQTVLTPAAASGSMAFGANVGAFFLGGRVGDPAAAPNAGNSWSYAFPQAGVYGIWVQRAGTSILNIATVNAQTKPLNTTAVPGQLNAPAAPLATSMGINGAYAAPTSGTFTGTTTSGSATITAVSTNKFLAVGQTLSGAGIATGAVITAINGSTITMSLAATASGTNTITASNMSTYVTTTNGSPVLTNVTSIAGIYPNQTIAGAGIPASTTIVSIQGNPGNYTITMSANATATANNISATTTGYWESFLRWPYVSSQN
ncbi:MULTISPECIES: hypothetical protein [unclassified Mesorhizobium]|uniref:hypothetical protein n=1 Tax=unclassified Mesorhizobium TaxID=325217 RepID=UPI000FCA5825|nr:MULTISPECIES: hypothetical protein [unclassified Mesorhizobium]RUV16960.1 hypothetical protein EOA91_19590 [Mesorhizobium sp. M1A.F.Ca.IN.022.04.1.1]RWG29741.1 MAG: hypothetical protein EOQ60_20395 [Mesorhizobium sp.]